MKLDQGVPPTELIAKFEEDAQRDRPFGLARVVIGSGAAASALAFGFGPILLEARRRRTTY